MKTITLILLTLKLTANPIFPITKDKQLHLASGFIISGGSILITKKLQCKHPIIIGISVGVFVGLLKEGYDLTGRGNSNIKDLAYTGIGSLLGGLCFSIKIKQIKYAKIHNNIFKRKLE